MTLTIEELKKKYHIGYDKARYFKDLLDKAEQQNNDKAKKVCESMITILTSDQDYWTEDALFKLTGFNTYTELNEFVKSFVNNKKEWTTYTGVELVKVDKVDKIFKDIEENGIDADHKIVLALNMFGKVHYLKICRWTFGDNCTKKYKEITKEHIKYLIERPFILKKYGFDKDLEFDGHYLKIKKGVEE